MSDVFQHVARRASRIVSVPVALLVIFLAKLLLPRKQICVVVMDPRFFGHQCLEPEVFWNDWQSARENGSKDLWFCCLGKKSVAANAFLWEHTREKFPTIPSWVVTRVAPVAGRLRMSNIIFLEASIYRLNFLTERETSLPPSSKFDARRREILSRLSDPERPYVVFTIREPDVSYDPNDPRNRDIRDFVPAMNALTLMGFNVVRLTSRTNYQLTINDPHILDWQVLVDGHDADELALLSSAAFVVSSTTGGDCLALAYRRPVLYVDSARLYLVFLATELATFSVPNIVDVKSGERLNLEQILARGLGWTGEVQAFTAAGVKIVNSDSRQIEQIVREYATSGFLDKRNMSTESQSGWRSQLLAKHFNDVKSRHGEVRAQMLASSVNELV